MPKTFEKKEGGQKPSGNGVTKPKTHSVNKQIRDLDRLLKKRGDSIPPEIKAMKENELADLRSKAKGRETSERERKTVVRYRMLKFIERKKVGRKIVRIERELSQSGGKTKEEKAALEKELDGLKNDLLYIANYFALFPKSPYRNPHAEERRDLLRKEISAKHKSEKVKIVNGVIKVAGDDEDEKEFKHLEKKGDSGKKKGSAKNDPKIDSDSDSNEDEEPIKAPAPKKARLDSHPKTISSPKSDKSHEKVKKGSEAKKESSEKNPKKGFEPKRESNEKSPKKEGENKKEKVSGWAVTPVVTPSKEKEPKETKKPQPSSSNQKSPQTPKGLNKVKMRSEMNQFELGAVPKAKAIETQKEKGTKRKAIDDSSESEGNDRIRIRIDQDDFFKKS